ncbi:MAG: YcxB family protein [Oscillospiraceae bacterium]|nr:YcxB family protein [Oscillospiraceae bacterium]
MEEKHTPILPEKQYHIPYEMFKTAFTAFQRRYVYPRNYLVIAVLVLACVIYTISILHSSATQQPLYGFVILCCLVMCVFQWYNPRKIRRNLLEAVKEIEEDTYVLRIFPEYLEIGTRLPEEAPSEEQAQADALFDDTPEEEISGSRIFYSKYLKVTEYQDFFMAYQKKSMFYVIPKSAFAEEELAQLRAHFGQVLGKGFSSK